MHPKTTRLDGDDVLPGHARLWRYMKIGTFFMLLEGKAFFPAVATLQSGDPLEGDLIPEPESLMGKLAEVCQTELDPLITWLEGVADKQEKVFLDANRDNPAVVSRIVAKTYLKQLAKRRAVWCWFLSLHESAGMWSVYGNAGIAVRTHVDALERSLPAAFDFQIAKIRYKNRHANSPLNLFDPDAPENQAILHRPHLVKGDEFRHENEVRVTTVCSPDESGRLVTGICPALLIEEVVISPLLPFEEAEALQSQIQKYACWGDNRPVIRRSSILGHLADEQETGGSLDALLCPGFLEREHDLPHPLTQL